MTETHFSIQNSQKHIMHGLVKMYVWLDNILYDWALICIDKLLGFQYAPLVANLILFCCERDFMMSLSDDR